jgi:serralysin
VVPARKQPEAAEQARFERAGNSPDPTLLGDAMERLGAYFLDPADLHAEGLVMFTSKKWQVGRTINFYFMDGPQWARDKVMDLGNNWLVQANLKFNVTTDRSMSDIRITFEPGGSWSYLGTDNLSIPDDEPTMQLGWLLDSDVVDDEDEWRRVVVHEFGHMLDFGHEQAHPEGTIDWNREAVLRYYMGPPNYWSEADVERQVFRKYSSLITNFSEYDPHSIMHYPVPPEFVLDPTDAVGFNDSRSKRDKKTCALWYPHVALDTALDALALIPGI